MRYLSLFSGLEAATLAWAPLGWTCVGHSEIDPFTRALLKHYYPDVPNLGDVTQITEAQIASLGRIDVLIFGSPCQDLSVAGKMKGLAGERSGLFHTAINIIRWARKHCGLRFALWENVPGAFVSNEGRDFAVVVEQMAGLDGIGVPKKGWGTEGCAIGEEAMVEWAVLDAQWFGVAQRRRRVFALADFGDWSGRRPILLEPESMRGDSAPSRQAGEEVAGCVTASIGDNCGQELRADLLHVVDQPPALPDIAMCLNAGGMNRIDSESETLIPVCVTGDVTHALNTANNGKGSSEDGTGRGTPIVAFMPARTFGSDGEINEHFAERDVCDALHTSSGNGNKAPLISQYNRVRKLTPRECERLQGMRDDYTLVDFRGKPAADAPRYKAIGNSMAVPVIRWIGTQIFTARFFA